MKTLEELAKGLRQDIQGVRPTSAQAYQAILQALRAAEQRGIELGRQQYHAERKDYWRKHKAKGRQLRRALAQKEGA